MKQALLLLVFVTTSVFASPNWQDPNARYSYRDNMTDHLNISVRHVDNVNTECQKESKARGLGGFGYGVDACTFWTKNSCTIILPKKFTKEMLGHETLHCLQGAFH